MAMEDVYDFFWDVNTLLARKGLQRLDDGTSLRELWVHHIEEYARHCGHADLLRECIDGRVGQ